MSSQYPPLNCKDVKRILRNLGFKPRPQKEGRGSHERWTREDPYFRVDVDCPKEPFSQFLIESMAAQAGLNKKQFYKAREKSAAKKVAKCYGRKNVVRKLAISKKSPFSKKNKK